MSYSMHTQITLAVTESDLAETFARWGVGDAWDIDYNIPRPQVMRRVNFTAAERGVTVWWKRRDGNTIRLAMERHARPQDNLRVLYLAIESMRMNEKRGVDEALMHSAYLQLTEPSDADPYSFFEVQPGVEYDAARRIFREHATAAHPDRGGTDGQMAAVNGAWAALADREGWAA